ncbi:hypothetical protein [Croceivirga thetidis]|uniref:TonB-dependent receptor plug domain-containing protein n=1 Tax=Croceivirga thetidis TaxID=2721623 RepID=A0ABX1GPZ9_9FLAO|nr:hypothetical protein [Croceivirga thetidis]NKI30867.1 hypothetical protein [Croceivirga thetidis]
MKISKLIGSILMFLVFGASSVLTAQTHFDQFLENYEQNGQVPREIAYLHLNKNVFLEGEQLAFKAYLWDRTNQRPANASRNLYVKLKTKKGAIISEQMLLLENGASFGLIEIDSIAAENGTVVLQAFTDYMRNFDETNHFEEEITILNSTGETVGAPKTSKPKLELFSEGGSLALNKENVIRIRLNGEPATKTNVHEVLIEDEGGIVLEKVKLGKLGEGQFLLNPKKNKTYFARYGTQEPINLSKTLGKAKQTLSIKNIGENLAITSYTNLNSSEKLVLAIHNGKNVKALDVQFDENGESVQIIPLNDLFDGMNIFTLCNEYGSLIAERYYYKISAKNNETSKLDYSFSIDGDSIRLTLKGIGKNELYNTLSASILPKKTKSYDRHHSLLSYTEIVPFTKGQIPLARKYFENVNAKNIYDLNNALITVSNTKNWNNGIKKAGEMQFLPENGITLYGTVNKGGANFIANGTFYSDARSGIVEEGSNTFKIDGVFPVAQEKLVLMEVNKKGEFEKPGVFLRFTPMSIPKPNLPKLEFPKLVKLEESQSESEFTEYALFQKVTVLDEVEVVAKKEEKRRDSIRDRSRGRVDFFDIDDTSRNLPLYVYLNQFGFTMTQTFNGQVNIFNRNPNNPTNNIPAVFLDDFFLIDFDFLYGFRMDIVDYVEINRDGASGLRRGGGGIIKIYTDPQKFAKSKFKKFDFGYQVPLGFELPKKYITPDYLSFNGKLFSDYGVIGWEPLLNIDEENNINLTLYNPGLSNLKLTLEGVVNGNQLISKELDIDISGNQGASFPSNKL